MTRKRGNRKRDILQIRADPAWLDEVNARAKALGLSMSAYVRMKVTEAMQAEGQPRRESK